MRDLCELLRGVERYKPWFRFVIINHGGYFVDMMHTLTTTLNDKLRFFLPYFNAVT